MAKKGLVEVVDNGVKPMLAAIFAARRLAKYHVEVGVPADARNPKNKQPLTKIAMAHEFGDFMFHPFGNKRLEPVEFPKRPVLRPAAEGYQGKQIMKELDRGFKAKQSPRRIMNNIGELMVRNVKRNIMRLKNPPNTEATLAHKSGSNPLVDTGTFHDSITHEVKKG